MRVGDLDWDEWVSAVLPLLPKTCNFDAHDRIMDSGPFPRLPHAHISKRDEVIEYMAVVLQSDISILSGIDA